jgi:hypothetical protein
MTYLYKIFFIATCLFCISFTGCTSISASRIKNDLDEGKSFIILPMSGSNIKWHSTNSSSTFFLNDSKIGEHFLIAPINAGNYKVGGFFTKIKNKSRRSFTHEEEYNSTLGNIVIERTPIKQLRTKEVNDRGRIKTVEETINIDSYYRTYYNFPKNSENIGNITIKSGEIVLMPSIWIDFEEASKSCERAGSNLLFDLFDLFDTLINIGKYYPDDYDSLYWECPIKAFYVNMRTSLVENFLAKVDKKYFPDGVLDKIVVRDFEFGMVPKTIESTEEIDGIKTIRYKIESLK